MDLGEIRDRIASLHMRRLTNRLNDEENAELKALYELEYEAQQARKASAEG